MFYKENKSLFFWRNEKWQKFLFQKVFIFNMTTDSFLVEKRETLEHVKRYVWKNSLNLDCQDSISFGIFQVA